MIGYGIAFFIGIALGFGVAWVVKNDIEVPGLQALGEDR